MTEKLTMKEIASFCKRKGLIFPSSEIYGGFAGFFDYGPFGSEMKANLKNEWWKFHVQQRDDIVGIDGTIITHPTVWVASGHASSFQDPLLECSKCGAKVRADNFIEEKLKIAADGMKADEITKLVKDNKLACEECGGGFKELEQFNLMFQTQVGPKPGKESMAYLRPETAQVIFADFKQVVDTARLKLPFGIAQMGRAFRNEIAPRNFIFRSREFEQMEIEYFIHPKDTNICPYINEVLNYEATVYSEDMQKKGDAGEGKRMTMKQAMKDGIIKTQWHAYWLATELRWFEGLGAKKENFRLRQHVTTEKSHYALDTWDLEYNFPFGWKELQGMANRTDFDLQQHIKYSKKDLSLFDEESKEKIVPHVVAEPSQGVDRAFLVFFCDAYNDDKERGNIVLKLHPKLAPVKVAVFPLVNKLEEEAKKIHNKLKMEFNCIYDRSGSIGRRYARQDEIGTPYCVTVDNDTLESGIVTIRDRDTTKQIKIHKDKLIDTIDNLIKGKIKFSKAE